MQKINGYNCFHIHRINQPDADTVIFMNGILNSSFSWTEQAKVAKSLGINTLRYDIRGQWDSQTTPGPYSIELLAQDLAALMDHCEINSAHLFGISYGGFIMQKFAALFPDRVKSMVIINSTPIIQGKPKHVVQNWCDLNEMDEINLYFDVMATSVFSDSYFEEQAELILQSKEFLNVGIQRTPDFSKGQYLLNTASLNDLDGDGLIPELSKIECPTHIISSENDVLYPTKYSKILAENIKNSTLSVIPKYGHAVVNESPDTINKLLKNHLEKHIN